MCCHGGTSHCYAKKMTSYLIQKSRPSKFYLLFAFVQPFQHCDVTQHRTLHKHNGLPWWQKPSLWQLWRHNLSTNIVCSQTVIWLNIEPAHKPSRLPWCHKPLLWQQGHYNLSKNRGEAILIPDFPLCHSFNTVTWLSIEVSTNPLSCHDGTSRRYGNNDVIFCPNTMAKQCWAHTPAVSPFQLCHMTQHQTLYKRSGVQW